uniref:Uncharacterized protein n=1 Tax=Bursaphelenchus xylophilus TaxID=6326 RepID=A0A1I7S414_BURXY
MYKPIRQLNGLGSCFFCQFFCKNFDLHGASGDRILYIRRAFPSGDGENHGIGGQSGPEQSPGLIFPLFAWSLVLFKVLGAAEKGK